MKDSRTIAPGSAVEAAAARSSFGSFKNIPAPPSDGCATDEDN
eukprot:CAMPEP_0201197544 /NCGR_PEP_ID=MMETSP0851-20130426/154987_1 /ASSEMBLY_ACC=CAM_ASM_000631 /TAXON_ID=183588 /ORGANISM="Pseudo-nitzschia fraudulenta, Strain WWA7" /LENGTH=42 /DNA_ID= /DNA_START= /DNA_END= /DNA_ORIENTATION=